MMSKGPREFFTSLVNQWATDLQGQPWYYLHSLDEEMGAQRV